MYLGRVNNFNFLAQRNAKMNENVSFKLVHKNRLAENWLRFYKQAGLEIFTKGTPSICVSNFFFQLKFQHA